MSDTQNLSMLYEKMFLIRRFEESVLQLFEEGKLFGTTHTYIGQEANAVGVITNLDHGDIVVSNHRCHGHYIIHKNNPYALLCEMMGKVDGLCSGRGGSQHICDDGFYSNGIQGGILPLSAGLAFARKRENSKSLVATFIGDGTLGEGIVYETLNIISKWELPVLIIVENNRYAQSTKIENTLSGTIAGRFEAFGIKTEELDTFDVLEIHRTSAELIDEVRNSQKPACLILNTYRFAHHSSSHDGRDEGEVEEWRSRDPLKIAEAMLNDAESKATRGKIELHLSKEIDRAMLAEMAL